MTRLMPDGSTRYCYGLSALALIISGVLGLLVVHYFGTNMSPQMDLWLAGAVGGNLGPLVVDIARRSLHF